MQNHGQSTVGNYNGYIENSDVEENYADFSLRIPTDKVDAFLDNMTKKDNPFTVKRKSYSSSDVTADYVDVEGRLAAKKKALEKYYDLMDQAKSINETMEVLNAISDLEGEIEGFESQLKSYPYVLEQLSREAKCFVVWYNKHITGRRQLCNTVRS